MSAQNRAAKTERKNTAPCAIEIISEMSMLTNWANNVAQPSGAMHGTNEANNFNL